MAKAVAVEQGDRTGRPADVAEFREPSERTVHVLTADARSAHSRNCRHSRVWCRLETRHRRHSRPQELGALSSRSRRCHAFASQSSNISPVHPRPTTSSR